MITYLLVFVRTIYRKFRETKHIIYLFVFAFFSNTPHVIVQVSAFYQIWQASVFHETLPQLPDFWNPIDIFPLCSPTFLFLKENLFNKYNIPYFTEVNLITLFHLLFLVCRLKLKHPFTALLQARVFNFSIILVDGQACIRALFTLSHPINDQGHLIHYLHQYFALLGL